MFLGEAVSAGCYTSQGIEIPGNGIPQTTDDDMGSECFVVCLCSQVDTLDRPLTPSLRLLGGATDRPWYIYGEIGIAVFHLKGPASLQAGGTLGTWPGSMSRVEHCGKHRLS